MSERSLEKDIEAPSARLFGSRLAPCGIGTGGGFENREGERGIDPFAAELRVEISGDGEHGISDLFRSESAKVKLPEKIIERVEGCRGRVDPA